MPTQPHEVLPERSRGAGAATPDIDAVDLVEESLAIFDLSLRVTRWNAEAERLYGWRRDEVIGGAIQEAVRCLPTESLSVILAQVLEAGTWRGEFTRTTRRGATVVVKATWTLRRDALGAPLDIVETSRDITQVRRMEESLDRVRHQYQNLFNTSVVSFWELDVAAVAAMVHALFEAGVPDLRAHCRLHPEFVRRMLENTQVTSMNEHSIALFGNGSRDAVPLTLSPMWPAESLEVFAQCIACAFDSKAFYSAETALVSLAGQRYDTLLTVSYPAQRAWLGPLLVGIVDITQSKRARVAQEHSERRYRDLFHFLPIPLMRVDSHDVTGILDRVRAQGVIDFVEYLKEDPALIDTLLDGVKIVEVNRRTVSMLRARSAEEIVGSVARYWTASPEKFLEVMAARYARKPGFEALIKMPAHDGTILDVLFFQTFASITGEQNFSVVQLIDVSDRIKAQEELARVQGEIAHASRVSMLGELTASIAHEVSQPLTAVQTNTEASLLWLKRSPPNVPEAIELAERSAEQVQRAAHIIDRIRAMAVRAEPQLERVALNIVLEETMLFLSHEFLRSGVDAALHLDANLPEIVGDRIQLQQVIVNLAVNAVQAMVQERAASRLLTVRTAMSPDHRVLIQVEDTGPGIAEGTIDHLFDRFFTTKATGMGIGLPISRSIVEAHGGSIVAANRTDRRGAIFTVSLPVS